MIFKKAGEVGCATIICSWFGGTTTDRKEEEMRRNGWQPVAGRVGAPHLHVDRQGDGTKADFRVS